MSNSVVTPPKDDAASAPMLRLSDVEKSFSQGKSALHVLRGASLTINAGEMVALVGPSGSGKSTLLNIAGLLENPDRGSVQVGGTHTARLSSKLATPSITDTVKSSGIPKTKD